MSAMFDRVAVLGVGLLGGSMGLALRFRRLARHVVGCSRTPANLREAMRCRAIDSFTTDPLGAVGDADLVVLAAPVSTIISLGRRVAPALKPGALVTDVGSTKATIVRELDAALAGRARFVGGHPMAGSDRTSIRYARGDLYYKAAYFITPSEKTDPAAADRLRALVVELGARPCVVAPDAHDRLVAAVSHVPHVVASGIAALVRELCGDDADLALSIAAGGFADTTRVAGSDPGLWTQIALENRDEVLRSIETLGRRLDGLRSSIERGDEVAVRRFFAEGREVRQAFVTRSPLPKRRSRPVVAIDGPAGAGKSTVSRAVAKALGFTYIDTGAMYRAVALLAQRAGLDLQQHDEITTLANSAALSFRLGAAGGSRICANGEDLEDAIRTPGISRLASPVSAIAGVRQALVAAQRAMGADGGVVMEGRDIQTVVFPDAEVKVFLTASDQVRARRRQLELRERGTEQSLEDTLREMRERDQRDSTRAVAPLAQAVDAVLVDTDTMTRDEVIAEIVRIARERMGTP